MEIVNLTGETINVVNDRGTVVKSFPVIGRATSVVTTVKDREVDGVPILSKRMGRVQGLPRPVEDLSVLYIVSKDVAESQRDSRFDLLVPGDEVNTQGKKYYRALISV